MLKTNVGFRHAVQELHLPSLGQPIQTAFYEPNAISLIEELPWVGRRSLVHRSLDRRKRKFSVRDLSGMAAGKTPDDIHVNTFLEHGCALKARHEYTLPNWIGCETEDDFRDNCGYLKGRLNWIAGNEDGIPIVAHRLWDNRYYLMNIDGANHFAAVYRQCIEQDRDFTFDCRIEHHGVDNVKCRKALVGHKVLILPTKSARSIAHLLKVYGHDLLPYCSEFQEGHSVLVVSCNVYTDNCAGYQILLDVLPPRSYFDLTTYIYGFL